ncbi:hypothetical protein TW83_01045 [Paracoccus sp. S4493]|nr:hypothetical protein TW83_01045 [Paracoccus sp. S4493]
MKIAVIVVKAALCGVVHFDTPTVTLSAIVYMIDLDAVAKAPYLVSQSVTPHVRQRWHATCL